MSIKLPKMPGMVRTSVDLAPDTYQRAKMLCALRGVSLRCLVSEQISQAVRMS